MIDIAERKQAMGVPEKNNAQIDSLIQNMPVMMYVLDENGTILSWNPECERITGYSEDEIVGNAKAMDLLYPEEDPFKRLKYELEEGENSYCSWECSVRHKSGIDKTVIWHTLSGENPFPDCAAWRIGIDVTERKNLEKELNEIKTELEEKRHNLKEINNALDVLLRKKDRDKKEIEENILFNIKETIFPYVKKLKNSGLNEKKEALLNIIESNLKELTSSFSSSLAFKLTNLTHTEIKIANLVKHGQTSKEIAGLLNLSTSTIDSHRKSIRKKLGIKGRKNRSLRALLLSIR